MLFGIPPVNAELTVAITTYRRPDLLKVAIESVTSQTLRVSCVVIDNGNEPETLRVVQGFPPERVCLFRNTTNCGMVGNWNQAIWLTSAKWMTILHDDDLLCPWWAETVSAEFRDGLSAVCTGVAFTDPPAKRNLEDKDRYYYTKRSALMGGITPNPGVAWKREVALQVGGFDEESYPASDTDFWYKLATKAPICCLHEVGAVYRLHENQATKSLLPKMTDAYQRQLLKVAKEQFNNSIFARGFAWLCVQEYIEAYAYLLGGENLPDSLQERRISNRILRKAVHRFWYGLCVLLKQIESARASKRMHSWHL